MKRRPAAEFDRVELRREAPARPTRASTRAHARSLRTPRPFSTSLSLFLASEREFYFSTKPMKTSRWSFSPLLHRIEINERKPLESTTRTELRARARSLLPPESHENRPRDLVSRLSSRPCPPRNGISHRSEKRSLKFPSDPMRQPTNVSSRFGTVVCFFSSADSRSTIRSGESSTVDRSEAELNEKKRTRVCNNRDNNCIGVTILLEFCYQDVTFALRIRLHIEHRISRFHRPSRTRVYSLSVSLSLSLFFSSCDDIHRARLGKQQCVINAPHLGETSATER